MTSSKRKKILLIVVIGILVIGIVAGGVYIVSEQNMNGIQDVVNNNKNYQDFSEDEKKSADKLLQKVVRMPQYQTLNDEEKADIVEKIIESEKIQNEIKNNPDKSSEEIQTQIDELKQNGASEEEVKSAEQEKAYWETVSNVKNTLATNSGLNNALVGYKIIKINGIYDSKGAIQIDAVFLKEEYFGGVTYFTQQNIFCRVSSYIAKIEPNESYEKILKIISESDSILPLLIQQDINNSNDIQKFSQLKEYSNVIKGRELEGYTFKVIKSWKKEQNDEHPSFLVEGSKDDSQIIYKMDYNAKDEKYQCSPMTKICPEFWAQLEKENAAAQSEAQNEQMSAKNVIQSLSTKDSSGNLTGFDTLY